MNHYKIMQELELEIVPLIEELQLEFNSSIMVLYGSLAQGGFSQNSDIDLLILSDGIESKTNDRFYLGHQVDAWIYSLEALGRPADFLHLQGARILQDSEKKGERFLAEVRHIYNSGPGDISIGDRVHLIAWCEKMLKRITSGEVDGEYRRYWLVKELLEIYFKFRGKWYEGSKRSLELLRLNDPEVYQCFKVVFQDPLGFESLEKLTKKVLECPFEEKK